jgi:hypothetical protein
MKALIALLAAVAVLAAASSAAPQQRAGSAATCRFADLPPATPVHEVALYGHIKSLGRSGRGFRLQFDPALWLGGVTAARAKLADTGSSDVSNDYYIRDETHRLLTFLVPRGARVTVLSARLCATRISVSELAQIMKGKNLRHRALFDRGRHLGFWIRVGLDTVRSFDQQYQP